MTLSASCEDRTRLYPIMSRALSPDS